jgi:hypothetical protein
MRRRPALALPVALPALQAVLAGPGATSDVSASETYQTGLVRWVASGAGFAEWELDGVRRGPDGALTLDPQRARPASDPYPPGGYRGASYYNGGAFLVGEATAPVTPAGSVGSAGFPVHQAIASWNAMTPEGTWLEALLRARVGDAGGGERWTRWYSLGVWASASGAAVERHSVAGQRDADGDVAVDTLQLDEARPGATAVQLRLRLFSAGPDGPDGGAGPAPRVSGAAVALSPLPPGRPAPGAPAPAPAPAAGAGNPAAWGQVLDLPPCSQMVYPDGGEVWCSPTSVAMVLGYWEGGEVGCAGRVRAAVEGVYDRVYRGHGNWSFNVAYAATLGMEAFVTRLTGLAGAEPWTSAGVPLVLSYGWRRGELRGAPLPSSNGHLAVLAGFDRAGDPVLYDPAAPRDSAVRRTYPRAQLEALWLSHSGGAAYVIAPPERLNDL